MGMRSQWHGFVESRWPRLQRETEVHCSASLLAIFKMCSGGEKEWQQHWVGEGGRRDLKNGKASSSHPAKMAAVDPHAGKQDKVVMDVRKAVWDSSWRTAKVMHNSSVCR